MPVAALAEDAGPARRQPGQVAAEHLVGVGGVPELDPGTGKVKVHLGHRGHPTTPLRADTVSPHEVGRARHRLQHRPPARGRRTPRRRTDARPTPTRSRCGWPSTSTTDGSGEPGGRRRAHRVRRRRRSCVAEDKGCEEMVGFATSAVRDAVNSDEVLAHVRSETGVDVEVLPGEDEARLTFLAVRRWFGWSAGRLAVFDIGGGSLEIAGGAERVARRGLVGAAGRRPADPRVLRRRRRPARTTSARCAAGSGPRSPATPARCCAAARRTARSPPPRRSARWPGSAARRRPATGRSSPRSLELDRPRPSGSPS